MPMDWGLARDYAARTPGCTDAELLGHLRAGPNDPDHLTPRPMPPVNLLRPRFGQAEIQGHQFQISFQKRVDVLRSNGRVVAVEQTA
jgi:hypothetical protein